MDLTGLRNLKNNLNVKLNHQKIFSHAFGPSEEKQVNTRFFLCCYCNIKMLL